MAGEDTEKMRVMISWIALSVTLKVLAAMIALSLLWVIFDSGSIISYAEIALLDCPPLIAGETNTSECREAQNEALAVVLAAGFGVLICFIYILFGGRKV